MSSMGDEKTDDVNKETYVINYVDPYCDCMCYSKAWLYNNCSNQNRDLTHTYYNRIMNKVTLSSYQSPNKKKPYGS